MTKVQSLRKYLTYKGFALFLTVALFGATMPSVAMAQYQGYRVQRGDTLSHIAMAYGVSVYSLMDANHIYNANHIYAGQYLTIPKHGGGHYWKNKCLHYYPISFGETLSQISINTGVSMYELADANNIYNTNHIYAGQTLCIPGQEEHHGQNSYDAPSNHSGETEVQQTSVESYTVPSTTTEHTTETNQHETQSTTPDVVNGDAGSHGLYTVQAGDKLETLAAYYGTTAQIMADVNGINVGDNLVVGSTLKVPVTD